MEKRVEGAGQDTGSIRDARSAKWNKRRLRRA
jgi:hypothetical protein